MPSRLTKTLMYAERAHAGQTYRIKNGADEPYIFHPVRVASRVMTEDEKVVALLHDVLEDTGWALPDWLSASELRAVQLLTRDEGTTYEDYIKRLINAEGLPGRIARAVKKADLCDNLAHDPNEQLRERYQNALLALIYGRMDEYE